MNYLQTSNQTNSLQPLIQKNLYNRFQQPQIVCIDNQSMNVTANALKTVKVQSNQNFQRGSRQYIIKHRNSNASTTSTSQSPQKIKKSYNKQPICINTEDLYLKENRFLSDLQVKDPKLLSKVASPCQSTQSSNKNDQAQTDKEDDSPLRLINSQKLEYIQTTINALNQNQINPTQIQVEEPLKYKQKNSSSVIGSGENIQKKALSPEPIMQIKIDEKKQFNGLDNIYQMNEESQQNLMFQDKFTFKNINKCIQISNLTNSKPPIKFKTQKPQEKLDNVKSQTVSQIKCREISIPPLQEIIQNPKVQELTQNNINNKLYSIQTSQKRQSVLRLSDPQSQASTITPEILNQQNELISLSSTLNQQTVDEKQKKQIIIKQGKKSSSIVNSKRKKLKKSKQQQSDKENTSCLKFSHLTSSQIQFGNIDQKGEFNDQEFENLTDQLENQQLFQKIEGNEFMDDENSYSEDLNEQENESQKDYQHKFYKENKKQTKTHNSIILPSLVQIGSTNQIEEQQEYQLKSKELDHLDLSAKSICIFDVEKKKSILSLKGKKSREVASLTKIMTCLIVCQYISKKKINQTDIIKVSRHAASMIGTSAYLRSGDQLSVWDLLHGLMLPSGNDAAFALAIINFISLKEYMGRQIFFENEDYKKQLQQNPNSFENCKTRDAIKCFLQEMNRVAKDLKLTSTKYTNPHGLVNKSNISSAMDICKLSAYCLSKSALFSQIVKTKQYTCQIKNKQGIIRMANWENTNKCLLRYNSICDGVKTGVTITAGPCLTTSWHIKDRHFIITILKCDSLEQRYSESHRIFVWMCEKLGIELSPEEKMPYEKVKQLYKRNSLENQQNLKESNSNSSISLKIKPIMLQQDDLSKYDKISSPFSELDRPNSISQFSQS